MAKADSEKLGTLHDMLAETLTQAIKEGIPIKDEETGKITKAPAPAAILNVARQFLKDNNIDCSPSSTNPIGLLSEALPFNEKVTPFKRNTG